MTVRITGASEHNLRHVDVDFGDGLTVVTGVSGSGKTSLVFDTLYHESRRRFLEVFALGSTALRMSPARVDAITDLGPAIAVGQNLLNRNPSSTLATASGLHPFLRLLYAGFGERHCARCGTPLTVMDADSVVEQLMALSGRAPLDARVPLLRGVRGSHATLLATLAQQFGASALRVDGRDWQPRQLDPTQPHDLDVELRRSTGSLTAREARALIDQAGGLGAHALVVLAGEQARLFSWAPVCVSCGAWFGPLTPVHFHTPCPACDGRGCDRCDRTGLHPDALAVRWQELRLPDLLALTVDDARRRFAPSDRSTSTQRLRSEINRRLDALESVGLGYIALDRPAPTLSRGEAQRVRLAVVLTSRLEDMLHVLDEPTVGQHPADVARLLPAFRQLAGPVVYVEHDRIAAALADRVVDLGPGAGSQGGQVVFEGAPSDVWQADTPTGRFFSLRERVWSKAPRPCQQFLTVRGADARNLKDVDVPIPYGRLAVITGVSGSGKSTFVEEVLVASLLARKPVGCAEIEGRLLKPVLVNQDPIGLNPRSNPATYTHLADVIRDAFAAATGLTPSYFSFNRPAGACQACEGMGAVEVRMRYLPSAWIPCSVCGGRRFSDQVLAAQVRFGQRDLSIADLYEMRIADVASLIAETDWLPKADRDAAMRILEALRDVGLGYLSLGQPSPTLSGGEAQRVKLAKYLGARSLASHLIVLDEPSTGLHPQDVSRLLVVLDRLARAGATLVVVEHNTDIIRAADWVIDLGPGAGDAGGRLIYAGPPDPLMDVPESATGRALKHEADVRPRARRAAPRRSASKAIAIREARANNLKGVDVDFPKGQLTVVTGVSGSGKSSLVHDVLGAEAERRFLESLSMYERQGTREGPEAPVKSVSGLGVAISVSSEHRLYDRRATVGTATELTHHIAILLALAGDRRCLNCGGMMARGGEPVRARRQPAAAPGEWLCPACGATAPIAEPRRFTSTTYAAACPTCHGVGTLQAPNPDKLIIHPDQPLCGGAMYSPGFFPKGYLCKPYNGGYDEVQALAERYGFDPAATPWSAISPEAQHAFLFGDQQPLPVIFHSRTGRTHTRSVDFRGFYGWVRDWDTGGTYTDTVTCPDCHGARLRPEYLAVTLAGHTVQALSDMPLRALGGVLDGLTVAPQPAQADRHSILSPAAISLRTALARLHFLQQVGLGYVHLNRPTATLSAGEAQRVKLAGLLGSGLTSLTVLLDEPSRGLHPAEVDALRASLEALRDEGNTVIVVEHDPVLMRAADYLIDTGPGAGAAGGRIVAQGSPSQVAQANTVTGAWLRGERRIDLTRPRRAPVDWLTIRGARANNLKGETVRLPLGVLAGVCGVSGSGKSTLVIDTLGRALAPRKQTTSVAREPIDPGAHDSIDGAPGRVVIVDQSRAGVHSPAAFLGLDQPLRAMYAESEDAQALGLGEKVFAGGCSACHGSGVITTDMGFLPDVHAPCEACAGTGFAPEAWDVRVRGLTLPELLSRTIDEAHDLFADVDSVAWRLAAARDAGLGYLVLRQPGHALSGGEAQRLKIAAELSRVRKACESTLYILDEPTVGQHLDDVARLAGVLRRLVDAGHSVLVIEHHAHLLAACDWLVEFGPAGGPAGGHVVAEGAPETVARGQTPTAPYLREVLEAGR